MSSITLIATTKYILYSNAIYSKLYFMVDVDLTGARSILFLYLKKKVADSRNSGLNNMAPSSGERCTPSSCTLVMDFMRNMGTSLFFVVVRVTNHFHILKS